MNRVLLVVSLAFSLAVLPGCKGDPNKPEYWSKAIAGAKKKKDKVRVVEDLRSSKKEMPADFLAMLQHELENEKAGEVRASIARILGEAKNPSSVEALLGAIDFGANDSDDKAANKEIVTALGAIGDKKAVPTLVKLLGVRDNYTVIAAIEALGQLKANDAFEPLNKLAIDDGTEPFISKKAIQALGDIGDPRAVPTLIRMMMKERRGVSFYVESSFALYQIGKPAADVLVPTAEGQDKEILKWAADNKIVEAAVYAKAIQVIGDLHDARANKRMIDLLAYKNDNLAFQLLMRMRAADALGRIRAKDASKILAGMLTEEEPTARNEYIRALVRIGPTKEGVAALVKAAAKGSWDARQPAIIGLAMLGDEGDAPAFAKLAKDEPAAFAAECKEDPEFEDCKKPEESTKKHVEAINLNLKRIDAAKECKTTVACWAKKLDDADGGVRERAAMELGRSNNPEAIGELTKRLSEKNLETRLAVIQATDWLVHDNKDAAKKAQEVLPTLGKQISDEKGKTEFVRVNEDLRRLYVKIQRS
jgi:HEAT repeat protein